MGEEVDTDGGLSWLMAMSNEIIHLVLDYLPLKDLVNVRLVCGRFQQLVDDDSSASLWARAELRGMCDWVSDKNKAVIERAAGCGNVEALIMLSVAYLYCEGIAEGPGKGTLDAYNGIKAAEYMMQAEQLTSDKPPFSWVLFRPPWALSSNCYKACVLHHMTERIEDGNDSLPGVIYCVGKTRYFQRHPTTLGLNSTSALDVFKTGAASNCTYSALEEWKLSSKPDIHINEFEVVRQLRKILDATPTYLEAQLELCHAYSCGYYGGVSQSQATSYMRRVVARSRPLRNKLVQFRCCISATVRFILVDWIVEVATMKQFSPLTVHVAVYLIDHYLCLRAIDRSYIQLLGISALLLSSRWTSDIILTIKESSWLTEKTFTYDDVVRMMGDILAAFKGDVRGLTIPDCLEILFELCHADQKTRHTALYLSESLLHHLFFTGYSVAHLASACLLLARVLADHDYPWPALLIKCTGYSVTDIQECSLHIYHYCLTDQHSVEDRRLVKLEAVSTRYNSQEFGYISKCPFMSLKDVMERLGVSPALSDGQESDSDAELQNLPDFRVISSTMKQQMNNVNSSHSKPPPFSSS